MAIIWNKLIPRWDGLTIEPPEAKKDVGYIAGDKPPAKWENWLRKGTYEALDETRDVIENIDSQLAEIELDVTDLLENKSIHSSGSNANGRWIRFQDGTQICSKALGDFGAQENSANTAEWPFPASFVSGFIGDIKLFAETLNSQADLINYRNFVDVNRAENNTKASVYFWVPSGNARPNFLTISLLAIGRWK